MAEFRCGVLLVQAFLELLLNRIDPYDILFFDDRFHDFVSSGSERFSVTVFLDERDLRFGRSFELFFVRVQARTLSLLTVINLRLYVSLICSSAPDKRPEHVTTCDWNLVRAQPTVADVLEHPWWCAGKAGGILQ